MKPVPQEIKTKDGSITILWSDQHKSLYDGRDLRLACRCATCVDEWTHESLLQPDRVPSDVKPRAIEVMGNYAVHIDWSDGHTTGIYTYDYLREVCACDECKNKRSFNV
jgi:ATP-binding protein involved in chromosome partitioning